MVGREILKFHKLESYQDFLRNLENVGQKGVYVWGFCLFDKDSAVTSDFLPYYVGKSRSNIHKRIQNHIYDIREGTHRILFKEKLVDDNSWNLFRYEKIDTDNYAYINNGVSKKNMCADDQVKLLPHINFYIDNLYVTYIPVNDLRLNNEEEKDYIDFLEKFVQEKIIGLDRSVSRGGKRYPETFCPSILPNDGTEHLFRNN